VRLLHPCNSPLSLGVKNITIGTALPVFLSPNVFKVLVENFNIRTNTTVEEDLKVLLNQSRIRKTEKERKN
jgi:hydroxylamine reductase